MHAKWIPAVQLRCAGAALGVDLGKYELRATSRRAIPSRFSDGGLVCAERLSDGDFTKNAVQYSGKCALEHGLGPII